MKPMNILINGERTSIRLEPEFVKALNLIAKRRGRSIHHICTAVAGKLKRGENFSSRLRVYILRNKK